jgi:hypothetical protein
MKDKYIVIKTKTGPTCVLEMSGPDVQYFATLEHVQQYLERECQIDPPQIDNSFFSRSEINYKIFELGKEIVATFTQEHIVEEVKKVETRVTIDG